MCVDYSAPAHCTCTTITLRLWYILQHWCTTQWRVGVLHIAPHVGQFSGIVAHNFAFCAAGTSQKVVEPLAPFQRFDSQPHPRSNVEVSNVLLQEVCQMMFLNWFHLEQLASM